MFSSCRAWPNCVRPVVNGLVALLAAWPEVGLHCGPAVALERVDQPTDVPRRKPKLLGRIDLRQAPGAHALDDGESVQFCRTHGEQTRWSHGGGTWRPKVRASEGAAWMETGHFYFAQTGHHYIAPTQPLRIIILM